MRVASGPDRLQVNGGQPPMTDLITGILGDVQNLLEQQFDYFRQEIVVDLERTKEAGYSIGLAGVFGILGGVLLLPALIGLLAWAFPVIPWWGWSGILAAGLLVAAVLLYLDAWNTLKSLSPLKRSFKRVKENVRWITRRSH